jgi:hypothetical protein
MQDIRSDAEGGVNAFIEKQASEPGDALLTLVQFDTEYEFVHRGIPVQNVPKYELQPRGATALLDAVGRAIVETGQRLSKMNEQDRPGLVIFVITTDGLENSSCEFTKSQVKQMIDEQQTKYDWHFTFLGADQNAFAEASSIGIGSGGAANYAKDKVAAAWYGTAMKVGRMRRQKTAGETVENKYTDEERNEMQ